jgi:predicted RNA binding protein YcfA (HicA-like mRNA interferase family)
VPHLPAISGGEAVSAFNKIGWKVKRRNASHIILKKKSVKVNLSVPDHQILKTGTLRNLIRKADITVQEFIVLL